jgi:ABC-type nickel/cobalt efflux system permease component RcnA
MMKKGLHSNIMRAISMSFVAIAGIALVGQTVFAHPLGNFTVNHYSRLQIQQHRITIRYIVDMAEIPAFQALTAIDQDNDGKQSAEEMKLYAEQTAARYSEGLKLTIDGEQVRLQTLAKTLSTPDGGGGIPTLRLECDFAADLKASAATRKLFYQDTNNSERAGWREIVIAPDSTIAVFDSNAFAGSLTDELKAYPEDLLAAPLDERQAELSFTTTSLPANANVLKTREGRPLIQKRDRFVELITVSNLTLPVALLGLLIAAGLGAVHAMSPGHGKTVVGAYLVGSRGTARHAAFLGLTVTITHTAGVIALGLVTLFASKYVLPEKLFPIISLISGVIVLFLGLNLFFKRLAMALGQASPDHHHSHEHDGHHSHDHKPQAHSHDHEPHEHLHKPSPALAHTHQHSQVPHTHTHHSHDHLHDEHHLPEHSHNSIESELQTADSKLQTFTHTHDGNTHTHLPPGADDTPITWRSLLALGISGGLLPCPSALVVLLTAISIGRVGYGLILVLAFSVGLAATLTAVGLLFLYAGRLLKRPVQHSKLVYILPVISAFVIACLGAIICYQALASNGFTM